MALLLDVRPLASSPHLHPRLSVGRFTVERCPSPPSEAASIRIPEHPNAFHNPSFEADAPDDDTSGVSDSSSAVRLENKSRHDVRREDWPSGGESLRASDSGLNISVADEASLVDDRSLDSGVEDDVVKVDLSSNGGGGGPPSKKPGKISSLALPPSPWEPSKEESLCSICVQVFIPFLIAGVGTCGAGLVLDMVEKWEVFIQISEIYILVPTLLGLKGNLEMTLASRVSTQANLGKLDTLGEQWKISWGNMAVVQCQATVMGFLSAIFATGMSVAKNGFSLRNALLLSASALFTASLASFFLGAITLFVVVLSHKLHINPDNVATPIAASLGDVTTLGLLAGISVYLYSHGDDLIPSSVILGVFLALVPAWGYFSYRNDTVRRVLFTGWTPVLIAVVITSAGGYILEYSVSNFTGITVFQPVINGVAGNLVAVQASRISTYFHRCSEPGSRPPDGSSLCVSPCAAFFGKSTHARTARILMAMVVPGHLLFGYGITLVKGGDTVLTPPFLGIYLSAAFIQVALLLYIAHCMIHLMWRWKIDPDNSAIPLLTALGDLSGMIFLTLVFFIYARI